MSTTKVKEIVKSFEELSPDEKRAVLSQVLASRAVKRHKSKKTFFYWSISAPSDSFKIVRRDSLRADDAATSSDSQTEHWGRDLIALRKTLSLGDWSHVGDSVDYVQKLREEERKSRLGDWGADE